MLRGAFCNTLTYIKLPFDIKIFVLSVFVWPFYTGFNVHAMMQIHKLIRNGEECSTLKYPAWKVLFVCLYWCFTSVNNFSVKSGQFPVFLAQVEPVLKQRDKVSCSRTQNSDSGESQTLTDQPFDPQSATPLGYQHGRYMELPYLSQW